MPFGVRVAAAWAWRLAVVAVAVGLAGLLLARLRLLVNAAVTALLLAALRRIWGWLLGLVSPRLRDRVRLAGEASWSTLVSYVRGIVIVAAADALLIGLVLLVLDVPLVLPLVVLTFLGAFVPLVGAAVAGTAATLVALVDKGVFVAVLVLVAVVIVQEIDSDALQPLILSRAVRLHPLVVGLSIATGTLLAGIAGAVVAVPVVASTMSAVARLRSSPN